MKDFFDMIEVFLESVDGLFPIALSNKQSLHELAIKFYEKGTNLVKIEDDKIISAVFGYTDFVENNMGYISVVASLPDEQGKGYASDLVGEFISIANEKGLSAVHLYAISTNKRAIQMYKKLGFHNYIMKNEPRPEDVHLIYYLEREGY